MLNYLTPHTLLPVLALLLIIYLSIHRNHLLMILLFLEMIVLIMITLLGIYIKKTMLFTTVILLTFGACEASIGLSLLVLMSRTTGSDHLKMLNTNKT